MDKKYHLKLYNTESRQKEEIAPIDGKEIRLYTCGPTVYNFAHIGNFRTYVFEDLLRRTLKFFGFAVRQAMNLTDVDDKTIRGALAQQISLTAFTEPFIKAFFEDIETLRIEKVEYYPKATDYFPEMISIIQNLLEKGIAYRGADESIYFSITKFPSYGRLSHLHLHDLKAGASQRVASDEYDKENISDFVLWKAYDPTRDGSIYWESPFGKGRPGWHIECSAMAMKLLGESIDIHVGGVDNMFPHHENEIAQSESFSCCRFVKHWLHAEHLLVDHKKMSKSLGNFYTLRDLLSKGFLGKEIRYLLLQTHYRTQLNFTLQGLEGSRHALERIDNFIQRLKEIKTQKPATIEHILKQTLEAFSKALADDLNISEALGSLFDLIREVNILCDKNEVGIQDSEAIVTFLKKIDQVLQVMTFEDTLAIPENLLHALAEREKARQRKDWKASDLYRDEIHQAGYLIEDTPSGARLKKREG